MKISKAVRYITSDILEAHEPRFGGYDYIFAGSGVWKRAMSTVLHACVPVAKCKIATLPDVVQPHATLMYGKMPSALLWRAIEDARKQCARRPTESLYHVALQLDRGHDFYTLAQPKQIATLAKVEAETPESMAIPASHVVADIHTHPLGSARPSKTDDADETGFRIYVIIGDLFAQRPLVFCRVGIFGDFWPVPAHEVFDVAWHDYRDQTTIDRHVDHWEGH